MKKEIVINADDLESRVAILENGQLAELHVEREARIVGSIYKARVLSVLPGMDAAFADVGLERNVFLCADDVGFVSRDGVTVTPAPRSASISQRLKERQEVVVQIVRAPVAGKGARASTRLAFPGRYLVLMVAHGTQVGVSRKIEDRKERARLHKIGDQIRPKDAGVIIRTEAEGHNREEIEADLKVLLDLRDRVMKKAARAKAPALLHQDLSLVYHVVREVFTDDVERLVIDEKAVYDNSVELVKLIAPKLRERIKLYRGKMPIFHKYGIEGEIDRLLRRKVWLPAGGYISIDQAEAFTAVDVNTGRYTGSTGLEDTILRTNLEAADEVARQLRLRDLGGIIVIDFIDMERIRNRDRVVNAFEEALRRDRQRTKILHLSTLGLIEMTRKRRGESLMGILTETCPHCAGLGRVRRPLTVALKLEREAARLAAEGTVPALVVRASPAVAGILVGERGSRAAALEKRLGSPVYVRANYEMDIEGHDLAPGPRPEAERLAPNYNRGQELTLDRVDAPEPGGDEDVYGWAGGLRVLLDTAGPVAAGAVVVLDEVNRSFGRAHVKGAKRKPAPRRRGRDRAPKEELEREAIPFMLEGVSEEETMPEEAPEAAGIEVVETAPGAPKPSRRRRRGPRRRRPPEAATPAGETAAPVEAPTEAGIQRPEEPAAPSRPSRHRRRRRPRSGEPKPSAVETPHAPAAEPAEAAAPQGEGAEQPARPRPRRRRRPRSGAPKPPTSEAAPAPAPAERAVPQSEGGERPARPRPRRRRRPRSGAPQPTAQGEAAPPTPSEPAAAPPPAEGHPKKMGLLRRGARTIAKVLRTEE